MKTTMNLTTDPWIPAVRADGTRALFSLQGLFAEAHELRDLAVKPHERIALMRLLLCIAQAALDGPEDEAAWEECEPLIQPRVRDYLATWRGAFELFGEGQRFLQTAKLTADKKSGEKTRSTKLDLSLATGNNSTLFDNTGSEVREIGADRAALNLLTFQCFTPSEIVGAGVWQGVEVRKTTGKQAPCAASSAVHTLLLGSSVLESIWLNLFDRQLVSDLYGEHNWGKPLWELPLVSPKDHAQHETTKENATNTYLGRLLPVSRLVRLEVDNQSVLLVDGIAYPVFDNPKEPQLLLFREPHSTVLLDDEDQTLSLLRGDIGKSFWRELGAVVAKRRGECVAEGPPALCRRPQDRDIIVWMGSLVTTKDEGIVDVIEGQYPIPKELLRACTKRLAFAIG
ncbi:MAG: type I-E CRISPR-associated protein Cse1/CasA [Limisphaerales bacterium]